MVIPLLFFLQRPFFLFFFLSWLSFIPPGAPAWLEVSSKDNIIRAVAVVAPPLSLPCFLLFVFLFSLMDFPFPPSLCNQRLNYGK